MYWMRVICLGKSAVKPICLPLKTFFFCFYHKQGLFTDEIRDIMRQRPGTRKQDKVDEVSYSKTNVKPNMI